MKNLSKDTFVPRKDPTRRARIEAAREEMQNAATDSDEQMTQPTRDVGGSPKRLKPKYYGHSPSRTAGRVVVTCRK